MEYSISLEGTSAVIFMAVVAVIGLFMIICKWRIYKKANKPGWASIIPIYSDIVLFEIAQINALLVILLFIPIINIIMTFSAYIKLSKKFNRGAGLGILMVLIPIIGLPILAFGKSQYEGSENSNDQQSSILDVDMSGVPNTSEEPEFKYGYEKEATIIMNPVNNVQNNEDNNVDSSTANDLDNNESNINVENNIETSNEQALQNAVDEIPNSTTENNILNAQIDDKKVIDNSNEQVINEQQNNEEVTSPESVIEETSNNTTESLENSALDAQLGSSEVIDNPNEQVINEQQNNEEVASPESVIEETSNNTTESLENSALDAQLGSSEVIDNSNEQVINESQNNEEVTSIENIMSEPTNEISDTSNEDDFVETN